MSTATEKIPVTFAGFTHRGTIPKWASAYQTSRATVAELCEEPRLPDVSVIQSTRPKLILEERTLFMSLCEALVRAADASSRLVLGFSHAEPEEIYELAPLLGRVPGLAGRIDLARQSSDLQDALIEALTKVMATRGEPDPLGEVQSVIKAGRRLRAASGRLDAGKVAEAFGLKLSELARQIGESKQRLSKTPDSEAIQPALRPYERIARLSTVLSEADFKAWLHTPNEHLEDKEAPIAYLKAGAQEPLAQFAENMLTGAST